MAPASWVLLGRSMTAAAEGRTNSSRPHCPWTYSDGQEGLLGANAQVVPGKVYANQKPLDPFGERQIRNRATPFGPCQGPQWAICTLTPHLLGYLASPMCWQLPLRPSCFVITAVEACLEAGHCQISSMPRDVTFLSHVPRVTHTHTLSRNSNSV
jgi:hypothetical protein